MYEINEAESQLMARSARFECHRELETRLYRVTFSRIRQIHYLQELFLPRTQLSMILHIHSGAYDLPNFFIAQQQMEKRQEKRRRKKTSLKRKKMLNNRMINCVTVLFFLGCCLYNPMKHQLAVRVTEFLISLLFSCLASWHQKENCKRHVQLFNDFKGLLFIRPL